MPISSAHKQGNGKAFTTATEIKTLLGLDNTKKEVEVQMLQHPQKQLEELKPKIQELETANQKVQAELETAKETIKGLDTANQKVQQLEKEKTDLENANKKAKDEKTTLEEQLKKKGEELKTANKTIEEKVEELETAKKEAEEKLKQELEKEKEKLKAKTQDLQAKLTEAENKQQELQTQLNTANTEKTDLQQQLVSSTDEQQKVSKTIDSLFTEELNEKIKGLTGLTGQDLKDKVKSLYDEKLKDTIDVNLSEVQDKEKFHKNLQEEIVLTIENNKGNDEITELVKGKLKSSIISASKFNKEIADLQQELRNRDKKIEELNARVQQLKDEKAKLETEKKNKIKDLEHQEIDDRFDNLFAEDELQQQLQEKDDKIAELKLFLQNQSDEVEEAHKSLRAKNKKIQQLKQGNGARYTAIIGMSSTAGLVAFIALKCTVRLDIWVMVGIAAVSAAVVGGITYAVLPSTQVDGAEAQVVNKDEPKK